MKITANELLNSSTYSRSCKMKGVLTTEEAKERIKTTNNLIVFSNQTHFFFSDDHCFGVYVKPDEWVPCTSRIPQRVAPRKGVGNGIIDTIEKYILVHEYNKIQISTIEEVVEIMNKGTRVVNENVYYRFGKKYKKLERHEVIQEGAMMSICNGELHPIANSDGRTVGNTPSEFSDERDFYNPIKDSNINGIIDMIQLNPNNVILRFVCPNHCSMEITDVKLLEYMKIGNPACHQCGEKLEYIETTLKKEK